MLGIDEGSGSTLFLTLGNGMKGNGGLSTRFRAVDLDHPPAWEPTNPQRHIDGQGARGDHRDIQDGLAPQPHDRPLPKLAFNLGQCHFDGPFLVLIFAHHCSSFSF